MNEDRISSIINQTEMTTVCVSKLTIGAVLDLKSQNRIPKLKNLILYDLAEDLHITLAS